MISLFFNGRELLKQSCAALTVAQVRRELSAEDERELATGMVPLHEISASQFLVAGLEIEEAQCVTQLYLS